VPALSASKACDALVAIRAYEALVATKAYEDVVALLAHDAVPNSEPVIPLVTFKSPVNIVEPLEYIDPVNINVSTFADSTVPVTPYKFVEPVTVNDPLINVDPLIVALVFTLNPKLGSMEAVTLPEAI
jgi:hypothetical protein